MPGTGRLSVFGPDFAVVRSCRCCVGLGASVMAVGVLLWAGSTSVGTWHPHPQSVPNRPAQKPHRPFVSLVYQLANGSTLHAKN